jgi:hypothetical protein
MSRPHYRHPSVENANSPWAHAFPRVSPEAAANIADIPKARTSTPGGVTAAARPDLTDRAANSPPAAVYPTVANECSVCFVGPQG